MPSWITGTIGRLAGYGRDTGHTIERGRELKSAGSAAGSRSAGASTSWYSSLAARFRGMGRASTGQLSASHAWQAYQATNPTGKPMPMRSSEARSGSATALAEDFLTSPVTAKHPVRLGLDAALKMAGNDQAGRAEMKALWTKELVRCLKADAASDQVPSMDSLRDMVLRAADQMAKNPDYVPVPYSD